MTYLKTAKEKKQLCFTYLTFMLNGLLALSIGSLLPFIRDARGLSYVFAGTIVSLHSIGNLISGFAAGALPVIIGRKKTILLFNACYCISYVLIAFGTGNVPLVLAFFMTGLARGATSNFGNYAVNNLAPGRAAYLNALHAMFSIGAFIFPIFLTLLTGADGRRWIYACYFMIVMGILSWLLYFLIPIEAEKGTKKADDSGNAGVGFLQEPLFYICSFTLFFYLCAEQGVIGWLITYFVDTGFMSGALSQLMASVLWVMMLAGRLTTAWMSRKFSKEKLLLVMGTGIVFFFFWLLFSKSTGMIVMGIIGFGYSMAGIYPTTVSFCGGLIKKYTMAWSFILTLASLGSIIMPSIIGKIAESAGIVYGMSSVAVVIIIDFLLIAALNIYMKKTGGKADENRKKQDMEL